MAFKVSNEFSIDQPIHKIGIDIIGITGLGDGPTLMLMEAALEFGSVTVPLGTETVKVTYNHATKLFSCRRYTSND